MEQSLDIFKKQLGQNVSEIRNMLNLNICEFSKQTNISENTIRNIEKGKILMRGKTFLRLLFFVKENNIRLSVLFHKL